MLFSAAAGAEAATCFSEDGMVETENGAKPMRDLVIGDKVLSSVEKKMVILCQSLHTGSFE